MKTIVGSLASIIVGAVMLTSLGCTVLPTVHVNDGGYVPPPPPPPPVYRHPEPAAGRGTIEYPWYRHANPHEREVATISIAGYLYTISPGMSVLPFHPFGYHRYEIRYRCYRNTRPGEYLGETSGTIYTSPDWHLVIPPPPRFCR